MENGAISEDWQFHIFRLVVEHTVYPKKYAHGFYLAVLCCGYTLTDFPISIRLTSLALGQSSKQSKATLMNMDKYFIWIHYEWLHNHNKAKHNKTMCIFLGIYCICQWTGLWLVQIMAYLFTCSTASYHMNLCWVIISWTHRDTLRCNLARNIELFSQNAFKRSFTKQLPFVLS